MKHARAFMAISSAVVVVACVSQADMDAWKGAPVAALDTHPIFLTMPVVRSHTPDGIEIRNYVNGANVGRCSAFGQINTGYVNWANYQAFTQCSQSFAACNNIFYIQNGRITAYNPIGTGGAVCYTDSRVRPGFRGPANI